MLGSQNVQYANAGSTGTTVNKLAKLTGAPSTAVITGTSDTTGILGIVVAGAGTSGSSQIAVSGSALCVFDAATAAGDYVVNSTGTAGDCHDSGTAMSGTPPAGNLGVVTSTNGSGGTYTVDMSVRTNSGAGGGGTAAAPYLVLGSNSYITDLNMMQATIPTGTYTWTAFNSGSVTNSNGARVLDAANSNGDQWRGETTPVGTGASFAAAFSFVGQNTFEVNHGVACGMGAFDGTNYFGIFITYLSGGTNIPPVIVGAHVTSVTANIGTVDYDSSVTATPGKTNLFKITASALSGPWTLQVGDGQGHWTTFASAKDFGSVTGTATKWWYGCDNNSAQATANAGDLFLTLKDAEVAP